MADGKIPGVRQASRKEVRELLKLAWARDEELSDRDTDARLLPDGRVLLYHGEHERGVLYPSRESLKEMKRRCAEMAQEAARQRAEGLPNPCRTLLPPIDDFLRDVEAHASSLGKRLRIPDAVLDGTEASLDAVDKALVRIPWSRRQVPDLVTPLVAYVGEVLRKASGGQWSRSPTTRQRQVPVFDPAAMAAWATAAESLRASAAKAGAEEQAWARRMIGGHMPKPIRLDVVDEPIPHPSNEPLVTASGRRLFQPFAIVFVPMVEPSKRIPLRSAVDIALRVGPRTEPGPAPPVTMAITIADP
jgi:hypothetical protein